MPRPETSGVIVDSTPVLRHTTEELRRRRIHLVRHGKQSLEQHLVNTFDVLTTWKQPDRVRFAGLVHSVYSTDVFRHQTFATTERDKVCALVGEPAERLAYLFCIIDRRELMAVVSESPKSASDTIRLHDRLNGGPVAITGRDAGDLLAVHMANAAEQCCRADRSPAPWLSNVSLIGRVMRPLVDVVPPVLESCATLISKSEEAELIRRYHEMVANLGCGDIGASELDWPVGEPLIWAALHSIAQGGDASLPGRLAASRLRQWGTPWDKRLSLRQWLQLCGAVCDSANAEEAAFVARRTAAADESVRRSPERLYVEFDRAGLLPIADGAKRLSASIRPVPPLLPMRFQSYIAGLKSNHEKPRMTRYPGLRATPWHDPRDFQLVHDLEAAASDIADEIHALGTAGFHDEAENIKRSGRWSVLFLYERGRKNEHNCSRLPRTVAVIEANRTILSLGGLAYFSSLEPGTHVALHSGPTNMRLRCHLGIDVPEGCGLRVGGIERTWEEGRCLVFDDSFSHEAWNEGGRPRLALIVDLWHPDLADEEVELLSGLHRYGTATGVGLTRYWNRNRSKAGSQGRPNGRSDGQGATVSQSANPDGS